PLFRFSLSLFLFFLLPPSPSSTLFPYTTLFRSRLGDLVHHWLLEVSVLAGVGEGVELGDGFLEIFERHVLEPVAHHQPGKLSKRSEEHTSELQSRFDLVCRLLLEKKKKKR